MKIKVKSKVLLLPKIADAFGKVALQSREVTELYMNPIDYYHLRLYPSFYHSFDIETQRSLRAQNIVGYFWGSIVRFDNALEQGEVRLVTRKLAAPPEA